MRELSARAQELADRFEQANEAFVGEIERLTEPAWRAYCPEEGRTVAAIAHHIAWVYAIEIEAFQAMAEGRPAHPFIEDAIDRVNLQHGQRYADCERSEVVRLARRNAAKAVAIVRGLTDEQLARTGSYIEGWPLLSVAGWCAAMAGDSEVVPEPG